MTHLPQPPRPHRPNGPVGYQPGWVDGKEVGVGTRQCASRYKAIREYIQQSGASISPTVLDIGAYTGYFCRRLVDDLGAQCTAVDNNPQLEESDGVRVIPKLLNPDEIRKLGHHDVTLCLSVLHHHQNWFDYLSALVESADIVFIETAHPDERMSAHHKPYVIGAHREMQRIGKLIAETPPLYGNYLRPLWVVDRRRAIDRDEMVGAVDYALRGIIAGNDEIVLDINNAKPVADALIQVLGYTGWSLTYDPRVVAARLNEVVQQPMPQIDHGPLAPPERFE